MAPAEPPPINVEPENCPQAVMQWYNLTSPQNYKRQCVLSRDLSLQAKKHLRYLGWKFWHVDKKGRWELRYTSPITGKNYISLRRACQGCIEEGGCNGNPQIAQENNYYFDNRLPSASAPKKETKRPRKPKKRRQRSDDDELGEPSSSMHGRGKVLSIKRKRREGEAEAESSQHYRGTIIQEADHREYENDSICTVCRFGGELVLCDQCPSSFHLCCLGLEHVPDGDWFCPSCCCKICKRPRCTEDCADNVDVNRVLVCHQCERRYHIGCLKAPAYTKMGKKEDHVDNENWFCSGDCEKIFLSLQKLVGKAINVDADNLTWTLLKSVKSDCTGESSLTWDEVEGLSQNESKLSVALSVLRGCFDPVIDAFFGRDMMADVVFSRGSELNRLNFSGFYTVVLERDEEVVSVATIRFFDKRVAEIPFVATRMQCRRQGMCGILMNEIEKLLTYLGVERLVLPSSRNVIDIWTKSFDFVRMTRSDMSQFLDYAFLNFEDTIMCHKPMVKQTVI